VPRILLIEDDAKIRSYMRRILEWKGYAISEAEDGHSGLAMLSEETVDLVITDLVMPGKDGLELLTSLRDGRWSGPVLAISGGLETWSPLPVAEAMGAAACLAKPFDAAELIEMVEQLLAGIGQP